MLPDGLINFADIPERRDLPGYWLPTGRSREPRRRVLSGGVRHVHGGAALCKKFGRRQSDSSGPVAPTARFADLIQRIEVAILATAPELGRGRRGGLHLWEDRKI